MLVLTLAAALSCPLPWPPLLAPAPHTRTAWFGDEKPIKALEAWLKLYRSEEIEFLSKNNITKDSVAMKYGLAKNGLGNATWEGDLTTILEATVKLETAEAAHAALEIAAVGIDSFKYTAKMAPYAVRNLGETWTVKFTSQAAKDAIAMAARGELKTDKARKVAMQAAGVRCLGLMKDPAYRTVLEQALGAGDEFVRVSAAEALGSLGDDASAPALIAVIERDAVDAVLINAAQSLRTIYGKYLPKATTTPKKADDEKPKDDGAPAAEKPATPPSDAPKAAELPESVRLAVRACIGALGRTTWRADMALVRLLDDFRSLETVPALVAVLERFRAHPEEIKSGKLSGLLLYQAHELLVGMTGAVFAADQPEKWREFWEKEKDRIEVTKKRDPVASGGGTVVAGNFCGIPVQGTRVVFIVDLSRSMTWPMDEVDAAGKKKRSVRIDFAKRELHRAIDAISPNAQFGLVTFNGNPKCEVWKKELVPANEKNRESFKKYVDDFRPDGGTNLWSGLEEALKIKSLVYGNRYTSNIDELFILSDGAPSVGDVTDPVEILRLVQECNKFSNVRINTIFISSATPEEFRRQEPRMSITPQELMRRMAEQNGGKFKEM